MKRLLLLSVVFAFCFSNVSNVSADVVVATWPSFAGPPYLAVGGQQAGISSITINFTGTTTGGTTLTMLGNHTQFNPSNLNINFARNGLHDFTLTYDLFRTDGPGANSAPTAINWSYSADAGPFVGVTTAPIALGANSHFIDFSSIGAINAATNLVFRATFSGSAGGNVSSLAFDNFRIVGVPEPGSLAMVAVIAAPLLVRRRRSQDR